MCVCKELDVLEGNISAQGCQKAGWYMVLKKNAHVYMFIHAYTWHECVEQKVREHICSQGSWNICEVNYLQGVEP